MLQTLDMRQWAAALLMFFGLLRHSNVIPLSGAQHHLKRDDLSLNPGGVRVTIRWSKTDQFRTRKRVIPYPRIKSHPLCPTQAVSNAFQLTPAAPPDGPAFPSGPAKGACPSRLLDLHPWLWQIYVEPE